MLHKTKLTNLYLKQQLSSKQIADKLGCSPTKIDYWLSKFEIPKRTISAAVYRKKNPEGNPFSFNLPVSGQDMFLYGLGLGLYWGEGTKSNKNSVRLGNSDPRIIRTFIRFLSEIYSIDREKLRFGLQIFNDLSPEKVAAIWQSELGITRDQFYKIIVTPSRNKGTYRRKADLGVLTLYFNNTKLRNLICGAIEKL
ncbi:MAG TPA: hypothetical protein VD967_02740 [Candidatus Paceibacterota bacterium]|nr:hypothetical protein [Candidatus Paceibacterota bacterium]